MRGGGEEGAAADGLVTAYSSSGCDARGVEAEASLLHRFREDITELEKVRNGGDDDLWRKCKCMQPNLLQAL